MDPELILLGKDGRETWSSRCVDIKGVLQRQTPPIVHTITAEPISLEEAIAVIRGQLTNGRRALFEEVLQAFVTRLEKITAFRGRVRPSVRALPPGPWT